MVKRVTFGMIGEGKEDLPVHIPMLHQSSDRHDIVSLRDPSRSIVWRVVAHIHNDIIIFSRSIFECPR